MAQLDASSRNLPPPASLNVAPAPSQSAPRATGVLHSMTGFGRATLRDEAGPTLTLTLKSINHRFLDLQLRLPALAEPFEAQLRSRLKSELARGHVECVLVAERGGNAEAGMERRSVATSFDRAALRRYVEDFRTVAAELDLRSEPDLNVAAQLPGMLRTPEPGPAEAVFGAVLERCLPILASEALASLQAMRAREGVSLAAVLRTSLDRLAGLLEEVMRLRENAQPGLFARLQERLAVLVGDAVDADRLLSEAALLAERSDVEEEGARLRTHVEHFRVILDEGGEVGKRLDFLLQEMNREANTLLAKTGGASADSLRITDCGLAMKAEIEKLREQVQNLE